MNRGPRFEGHGHLLQTRKQLFDPFVEARRAFHTSRDICSPCTAFSPHHPLTLNREKRYPAAPPFDRPTYRPTDRGYCHRRSDFATKNVVVRMVPSRYSLLIMPSSLPIMPRYPAFAHSQKGSLALLQAPHAPVAIPRATPPGDRPIHLHPPAVTHKSPLIVPMSASSGLVEPNICGGHATITGT